MIIVAPGTTSKSIDVQILDDSGLAVTALVAATFPSVSYSLGSNVAATSITLSDLSLITTAYTSGGVKERSGGWYRLDLPNAALSSAGTVTLIGEASGKHLIAPVIQVGYIPGNIVQSGGISLGAGGRGIAALDSDYYNANTLACKVQLDASQSAYAPAKAGAKMDLVDSPNANAISLIQSGLATSSNVSSLGCLTVNAISSLGSPLQVSSYVPPDNANITIAATQSTAAALGIANVSNANGTIKLPTTAPTGYGSSTSGSVQVSITEVRTQ